MINPRMIEIGTKRNCGEDCTLSALEDVRGVEKVYAAHLVSDNVMGLLDESEDGARRRISHKLEDGADRNGVRPELILAARGCAARIVQGDCTRFTVVHNGPRHIVAEVDGYEPDNS